MEFGQAYRAQSRIDRAKLLGEPFLDLGDLGLDALPESLWELTALESLDLSGNKLASLPETVGELSLLRSLDLTGNMLDDLPESLGRLTLLRTLRLDGNPLHDMPPEVLAQGTGALQAYLRDLGEAGERQWRSKVVVLGEAKVGKTSLVKALSGQGFDPAEPMTHGVTVTDLALAHPEVAETMMHLSVWDFGGQRTYRSAHRFYLTNRSLFLMVFNCREEWDDPRMREWLKAASARGKESAILLIGTHSREHRHGLPLATLRRDFPQIVPEVFYVDSAYRTGIDQLLAAVTERAARLPLMGVRWPKSWLRAVDAVAGLPGDHAPLETVDGAMAETGLQDPETRANLRAALHHRGEILHFADEADLADIVVLRPTWLDGHVTKILDSVDVHDRHGLLSRTELDKAWPGTPHALRSHLLGLMGAFDLAYRVDAPEHDDVCLVVDRLPHDPPQYSRIWDGALKQEGADEVRVVVDFDGPGLLAGIPTWFIAREHRFTTDLHWRYGALLYDRFDSKCHALLVADERRGTVELAVRGIMPVTFMSVLRAGFVTPLHQRYPDLEWTIKIPCPCRGPRERPGACRYLFESGYLRRAQAKRRTTVECQETLNEVPIERLLYGLERASLAQIARGVTRLRDQVSKVGATVEKVSGAVGQIQLVQQTALEFQRRATELQQAQSVRCPSVFTITRKSSRMVVGSSYELRLYCEQPGNWHPLPGSTGVFIFRQQPAWLRRSGPYLRILVGVLEHALPLAGPALAAARDLGILSTDPVEQLTDLPKELRLREEIEGMRALVEQLPQPIGSSELAIQSMDSTGRAFRRAVDLADFRELRGFLEDHTPQGADPWGGLQPMITPEGIVVFVCREHAAQYAYPRQPAPPSPTTPAR